MSKATHKASPKSLNDSDIATYARRSGPNVSPNMGTPGSDADAHSDTDAPTAATDHDTEIATDKDQ